MADLLDKCPILKEQASHGKVAYGVNIPYTAPITRKSKTFDLAVGRPVVSVTAKSGRIAKVKEFSDVLFTCEAKAVMTEHSKSQPRVYDELSSSHEIVHQGSQEAIATGVTIVNIASTFVSPLRQSSADKLYISKHNQPQAVQRMIEHLRGLPIRDEVGQVGFDAYCTIVVDNDNQSEVILWREPPAPQPGEPDCYDVFIDRIARIYTERFSDVP